MLQPLTALLAVTWPITANQQSEIITSFNIYTLELIYNDLFISHYIS